MEHLRPGYWQAVQEQAYYGDDIDPQLLDSGMWTTHQELGSHTPQQMGQHPDQSNYLQSVSTDRGQFRVLADNTVSPCTIKHG